MKSVIIYSCFCFIISGCIFSDDEIHDVKIVDNYFVSSFNDGYTLLYKRKEDLKLPATGTLILDNIDSIGWDNRLLIAHSTSKKYNIILLQTHEVSIYPNYNFFFEKLRQLMAQNILLKPVRNVVNTPIKKISATRGFKIFQFYYPLKQTNRKKFEEDNSNYIIEYPGINQLDSIIRQFPDSP